MKTNINPNTLMTQIIDADQMIKKASDESIDQALDAINIIQREAKDLGFESRIERRIHTHIDALEVLAKNKITQINLQNYETIRNDTRKEDERNCKGH